MSKIWNSAAAFWLGLLSFLPVSEARPALIPTASLDAFRDAVQRNWVLPKDLNHVVGLTAEVTIDLDRSADIVGSPKVHVRGGTPVQEQQFSKSIVRAIVRSAPFRMLPPDKYGSWNVAKFVFSIEQFEHMPKTSP